ncbi:MAG: DUF262 domain-containing HNH endonuclease family protein [Planctomycetota bacterium]
MNKKTLTSLFVETIYRIPNYQRGYAWEEKQWKDFIQDIDALVDENLKSHYTGTVVVYAGLGAKEDYGTKRLDVVDVVDGQQRLTTSCLYLSVIIRALRGKGNKDYEQEIPGFLYWGTVCKLALNNDTADVYYDLLKTGRVNTSAQSTHAKRLVAACNHFQEHIDQQMIKRGDSGVDYLKDLFRAITQKLNFTFYVIDEECEIGMTFELMNSRGKGLSVLELLKNYLMYWVSRNERDPVERNTLTALINKNWKDTYTNLGSCSGNEEQCLRVAWTLFCNHSPQNWIGYDGFKGDDYFPLRNFTSKRTVADTRVFIGQFADGLAEISSYYASITSPTASNTVSQDELLWLTKIHHTGNIANFLPLMVAARKHCKGGSIPEVDYVALLKALECFAYRVFLHGGRRSNAGKSSFYRWAYEILPRSRSLPDVIALVHALTRYYASEESFVSANANPGDWYATRNRLKYTLFEYELHLLATEGKGKQPNLTWEQLNDTTIEHILPQTPKENSNWKNVWSPDDFKKSVHDIANLVLTRNNSNYLNFEFARKKGKPGQSPSYNDSDIRQERKISSFSDWTPKEFAERRSELMEWINVRWKTDGGQGVTMEIVDEADDDGIKVQAEV